MFRLDTILVATLLAACSPTNQTTSAPESGPATPTEPTETSRGEPNEASAKPPTELRQIAIYTPDPPPQDIFAAAPADTFGRTLVEVFFV